MSKSKLFAGEFRTSTFYNNATNSDKVGISERASRATLRTTGDKFQTEINNYQLFLKDPEELPRLSILDNYRQIMRIMTDQYIKSEEDEKKYRNRSETEATTERDPEYARYQEQRTNT